MNYTIPQGQHEATPASSCVHVGQTSMTRYVTFSESCRYELPAYNSLDANKLFGLSFGLFAVHQNSARFGWYYDKEDDRIVLVAYCYVNSKRNQNEQLRFPEVARVKINERVLCELKWNSTTKTYDFFVFREEALREVSGMVSVPGPKRLSSFGLTHSAYFGGVLPAPHDIHLIMSKA